MANLVFYDFETCSSNVSYGQIIQAAAVLVNDNFQELDRYEGRCKLSPGIIPEAMALIVNKTTPKILKETNLSHYQMIRQMMEKFNQWKNSIFIGYNSINFDEEFLRRTLFKNLDYPYLTVTNGNERADLFSLTRASYLYYPNCIKTPISAKNNPVFKLDKLAPMNGIKHDDAHSAISDVLATVEIAKLLSKTAPNVWKTSLMTTNKDKTLQLIKNELTFCTDFFYYGKSFPFVLTYVCEHPQWGYPMCFDLKSDPKYYFNLSISELKKELKLIKDWEAQISVFKKIWKPLFYKSRDVVFGTCIGSVMDKTFMLSNEDSPFDTVIIDEAAKANLSETLAPISI